ncbi:hypothetical protein BCV70DRAFT_123276 [Testicularia cyperi]|uniref:Alpha/beta-hydrolase n=1 Tax=Testicularia cyperi TaxID=1882483 RepID=A0A317XMJ3_9BASI|nr:hypothetical protein BCV70DRAFT_123276 [Testicularia cyperi]
MRGFARPNSLGALALLALVAIPDFASASSPLLNRIDRLPSGSRRSRQVRNVFGDDLTVGEYILSKRQSDAQQQDIVATARTDPITAASTAETLPNVAQNDNGGTDTSGNLLQGDGYYNYAWNSNVYFNPSAATNGSDEEGWQELPDTVGFTLNRTFEIKNRYGNESGIMPFYLSNVADNASVLRAIIVMPGKPRDSWKYSNLMLNARSVAVANFQNLAPAGTSVTNDTFLILGPAIMNNMDITAGATRPGELAWHGSGWQRGSPSIQPAMRHGITSYEMIDTFVDLLFDKNVYPNLNQVVIAGHSMGGQATQRYAVLKKTKKYDDNMRFWIGNPGSWAWLHDSRPYMGANLSCLANDEWDTWPYGLGGNQSKVSVYARRDVKADKTAVVDRFINRQVSYGLALLDIGAGDTHCQAKWQGGNHLDRGSQFVLQFGNASAFDLGGKFPSKHSLDYVANVTHQDYAMYSTNATLNRIFFQDLNVRHPELTNVTNPGDKKNSTKKKGEKAFATPAHEKVAIGLLAGSLGLVFIFFTMLPVIFTADQVRDIDTKWDAQSYVSQESRRMLVDRKY